MKCQFCGAENIRSHGPCRVCGKPLGEAGARFKVGEAKAQNQERAPPRNFGLTSLPGRLTTEEIARGIRMDYMQWSKDSTQKAMDALQELMTEARSDRVDSLSLLDKAAKIIHQQFRLRWVAIGTKSSIDGMYHYDAFVGLRDDAIKARKREAFSREDFSGTGNYIGRQISDQTMIFLEEDKPYKDGAEDTFNRPALMHSSRRSPDDSLEADYIDVHIYGRRDELLGWIEASGTTTGKLPDVSTIRWMEIFASMLGVVLSRKSRA